MFSRYLVFLWIISEKNNNMPTVTVKNVRYETLQQNPLFFIHKEEQEREIWIQTSGQKEYKYYWATNDDGIACWLEDDIFGDQFTNDAYMLVIAEITTNIPLPDKKNDDEGSIEIQIHNFQADNINDWIVVLNSCIFRMNDTNNKYVSMALLWCLHHRRIKENVLEKAIHRYDIKIQTYLTSKLKEIGVCLSIIKQQTLQRVLANFDISCQIYNPTVISEALGIIAPKLNYLTSNLGLFDVINLIFNNHNEELPFEIDYQLEKMKNSSNILLNLYVWLHDDAMHLEDYDGLKRWFGLLSESMKMKMIRRYFHDIRLGVATYDVKLLESFKNNRFEKFTRFRYCIENPEEPISLIVPLLCDSVITFVNSEGRSFQSLDGILDVAITHCDNIKPNVDFALKKILPICNGGAVYNQERFKGFIDYEVVYQLMEEKMATENLENSIKSLLKKYAKQSFYYVCTNDNSEEPLSSEQVKMCNRALHDKPECLERKYHDDIWIVRNNKDTTDILNCLLSIPIESAIEEKNIVKMEVNWGMISTEKFAVNIRNLTQILATNVETGYIFKKDVGVYSDILKMFYKPSFLRVYSRRTAVLNPAMDFFGLWAGLKEKLPPNHIMHRDDPSAKKMKVEHRRMEASEIKGRVEKSLVEELKTAMSIGGFFEIPYNDQQRRNLFQLYYYKGTITDDEPESSLEFLERIKIGKYVNFCAPSLADKYNHAVNLPYFWCRGRECFRNNLDDQILEHSHSWEQYSLYHIIEILGYPKLKRTEAGLEPDGMIRLFIAMVNRAHAKFRRLKCRSCGHLMFTDKSSGFNRYNYYSCINPTCGEFNHPVYLNYCYKCKKGLIDSRDSKQCPNDWYICPICLSCCDDELYERQAQRYTLSRRPIPERILRKMGQGHNDKDVFFCPDCGIQITEIAGESQEEMRWCAQCEKKYPSKFKT